MIDFSDAFPFSAYKAKGALKQDDLRRRREEQQVEIRRQKREENISKRRNFLPSANADSDEEIGGVVWDPPVGVAMIYIPIDDINENGFNSLLKK